MKTVLMLAFAASTLTVACANNRANEAARPGPLADRSDNTSARTPVTENATTRVAIEKSITQTCGIEASTTYFEFDSAAVAGGTDTDLSVVANCFADGKLKGRNVRITGYTDARGTEQYNKELGKSRAETVAAYMEAKGVKSSKIITKSRGEELSVGKDDQGFAFDRRVDISLAD